MGWLRGPEKSRNQKGRRASLNAWMLGWVRFKIAHVFTAFSPFHCLLYVHLYVYVHILISVNN